MKKGQSQLAFVFILIVAVFILLWGLGLFDDFGSSTTNAEIRNFATSLERAAKLQSIKLDSVKELSLALPESVETVCFLDKEKEFDELANIELSKKVDGFPDHNVILSPFSEFNSFDVDYIAVDKNPLCVENKDGKILLKLTGKEGSALIESFDIEKADCTTVLYHGEDNVDVVFLADGYENEASFNADVNDYVNIVFEGTEPFETNIDKFNFYRVDELNLGCEIKDYISCNSFKAKQLASSCPNDYIFVLVDRNKVKDLVNPIRSSSVSNLASINTADDKFVLVHEFGHSFGGLADEYVDDSYYRNFNVEKWPNCDFAGCGEWGDVTAGCFSGCSVNQFFRSSENSIMRNYLKSEEFGVLNDKVLEEKLSKYG